MLLARSALRLFSGLKFTKNHEWVLPVSGTNKVRIGITNYAQEQLGEIIHVELPSLDSEVTNGGAAATIQSVKVAADVYAPATGKVVGVNDAILKDPTIINTQAQKTWIVELSLGAPLENLMTDVEYKKYLEEQKH